MPIREECIQPTDDETAGAWKGHTEVVVDDLATYIQASNSLTQRDNQAWIWRGQCQAQWGLLSKLHRDHPNRTESEYVELERQCLDEARNVWKLGRTQGGTRLSALELLALLQHHSSPTRLLDFSSSALIALWFAVTPGLGSWNDPERCLTDDSTDGRVFAVDVSDSGVHKHKFPREIELELARSDGLPWADRADEFGTVARTWTPEALFPRLDRQLGCFLVSTTPDESTSSSIRIHTELPSDQLERLLGLRRGRGRYPGDRLVLFRIPAASKHEIKQQLDRTMGFRPSHMYPDPEGFALTSAWDRR